MPLSLVSGCTPCSPGCDHCWALAMEHRFYKSEPRNFDGSRKIKLHADRLSIPLKRKKPTVYAVWNDLHHEKVSVGFKGDAYETMSKCPQHTFLVLTKRPQWLHHYVSVSGPMMWHCPPGDNVWHGLTICNQQEADEKIPVFLQVPGKKFLSIEPMLSNINILPYIGHKAHHCKCGWHETEEALFFSGLEYLCLDCNEYTEDYDAVDAVILGGETGSGARSMHPDWVRSIKNQCAAANTPFFFKQWGEWIHESQADFESIPFAALSSRNAVYYHVWTDGKRSYRVGRKAAGRLLDSRTHDDLPWVKG